MPVFAAGNTGRSVAAPAVYPESLAVGALGPRGRVARFSSREPAADGVRKPDLAGPGVEVVSSVPGGGWASLSGTSMAAPHVAGTIALLRQADPALGASAIEPILRRTARDVGPAGADGRGGAGALDARAAVAAVLGARAPRPGLSLVAVPPALTNDADLTFALESGGAPLGVWLDGARAPLPGPAPSCGCRWGRPGATRSPSPPSTAAAPALDAPAARLPR